VKVDVVVVTYNSASQLPELFATRDGAGDWFNLDVQVSIDGEKVDFAELFAALAKGESHLVLDGGTWFSLDRPELDQLRAVMAEATLLAGDGS